MLTSVQLFVAIENEECQFEIGDYLRSARASVSPRLTTIEQSKQQLLQQIAIPVYYLTTMIESPVEEEEEEEED